MQPITVKWVGKVIHRDLCEKFKFKFDNNDK